MLSTRRYHLYVRKHSIDCLYDARQTEYEAKHGELVLPYPLSDIMLKLQE